MMDQYVKHPEIRWSDIDANVHLKHSAYYDFGAYVRIAYLFENGLTPEKMKEMHIGPILLREEAKFRREIVIGDKLSIDLQVVKARKDFSRWTIRHQLIKNNDAVAAILTVDGAWLNTQRRRMAIPPPIITAVFEHMPRSSDFEWDGRSA